MPVPIRQLKREQMYTVTKVGETKPTTTGRFTKLYVKNHPYGPKHELPAAQIEFAGQAGLYSDGEYTFEEMKGGRAQPKTKKAAKKTCAPGYEVYNFRKTRKGVFYDCLPKKRKTRRARSV